MEPGSLSKSQIQDWPDEVRHALSDLQIALRDLYGEQAPTLLLYGSYARGEAASSSDVDVLLLYPRDVLPGREINRLSPVLSNLNIRYQVLISVLPVSSQEYENSMRPFWRNIRREVITID